MNALPYPRLRDAAAVGAFVLFLFCHGMDGRVLRRASEGRVARVAQEMLDTGDWMVPRINGAERVQKPPASSWPAALAGKYFGGGTVRTSDALLGSAIAGILLAMLLYVWLSRSNKGASDAERERTRSRGMMAALVFATCPAILGQARCAELDMLLALFVALAFFAWERYRVDGCRKALLLFYAALALGVAVKGHVALVCVVLPLAAWSLWERRARRAGHCAAPSGGGPWTLHLVGLVLFLALTLPWLLPFLGGSGITWEAFQKEGLARFGSSTGHQEWFGWYVVSVPPWTLPWFALLPIAVWYDWKRDDADAPRRRIWWCWFLVNLVFWSILSAKQRHYVIPWLPPLALLIGDAAARMVAEAGQPGAHPAAKIGRGVLAGLVFLLAAALLGGGFYFGGPAQRLVAAAGAFMLVFGTLSMLFGTGRQTLVGWWVGFVLALGLYAQTFERKEDEPARAVVAFCEDVRAKVPDDETLYDTGLARAHVLFYIKRAVTPAQGDDLDDEDEGGGKATPQEKAERLLALADEAGRPVLALAGAGVRRNLPGVRVEEVVRAENFGGHKDRTAYLLRVRPAAP
ncbi:MAG: phospholipid carrier-dependent glycosyltransferase [Planctomycetes bacterium]|nr:phospholipid carrier-dependent glycosyltransferase [Planctomycetota bacterium]